MNQGVHRALLAAFLAAAILLTAAPRAGATVQEIRFRAEARVAGDTITLADLAELPPEAAASLGPIPIWGAPPPGQIYTLTGDFLRFRLVQLGLEELAGPTLPAAIPVKQEGVALAPEEVAKAFQRYIREHSQWPEKNLRIEVFPLEEPVLLPDAGVRLEALPPKGGRLLGDVSLEMVVTKSGQPQKRFKAAGRVRLEREVVCAVHPLKPQQLITAADVALCRRDVTTLNANDFFTALDQVVGRTLAKTLGPQEILTSRHLSQQPLIQRGDEVTVLLEENGLAISTKGVAKEPGFPGKAIRMLNPKSKKEFQAQVINDKTVKVTL
jgi:flagella basal body P-ring formation protein FlgA